MCGRYKILSNHETNSDERAELVNACGFLPAPRVGRSVPTTNASFMTATCPCRVRFRFAKRGDFRLVSHHDLLRCLERMLRRAALPISQTQGFNPRPKVSFPLALALGIEGRREVLELEFAEPLEASEALRRLVAVSPAGLDFLEAEPVMTRKPARVLAVQYSLEVPAGEVSPVHAAIARFLASESWPFVRHRPDRTMEVDLRPFVKSLELDSTGLLRFCLEVTPTGSARPEEVVEALGLRVLLDSGQILVRTEVELAADLTPPVERASRPMTAPNPPTPESTGPLPERTSE